MTFSLNRRDVITAALASVASATTGASLASDRPPMRVIVPSSAGSGLDVQMRAVTVAMTKALGGQPVVVENLPGAGGITGTSTLIKAAPDGNTLGFVSNNHSVNPSVYRKMPFDSLADITSICVVGRTPFVLVVNPRVPAKNAKEFQALLKAKPETYNYASSGNGTIIHLAAAQFLEAAGVEAKHIPYKGVGPMVTDMIGGTVEFGVVSIPAALPHLQSGSLRAIGVFGDQRIASIPDVSSMAEQGFASADIAGWFAFIGPPKMPAAEVTRLHNVVKAAFALPEAKEAMARQEVIVSPMSVEESARYFRSEQQRYAALVKKAGVTLD